MSSGLLSKQKQDVPTWTFVYTAKYIRNKKEMERSVSEHWPAIYVQWQENATINNLNFISSYGDKNKIEKIIKQFKKSCKGISHKPTG